MSADEKNKAHGQGHAQGHHHLHLPHYDPTLPPKPVEDEVGRVNFGERVVDTRSVLIGLLIFCMVVTGAYLWRIKVTETVRKVLKEFEFVPSEPDKEKFEMKEPQREILREREEIPDELPEERPNIQISPEPVDKAVEEEIVKTDEVEVREEVPVKFDQMDIPDTPEHLDKVQEEVQTPLTPIAVLSPKPADMYAYKEPLPSTDRSVEMLSTAPMPDRVFKMKPTQLGDQNAPTMGEIGSAAINLFGDGAFRRDMRFGGLEARHSVDMALRWLFLHQEADGGWNGAKWNPDDCPASGVLGPDGKPRMGSDCGITGMALMALLGGGHTIRSGEYRSAVLRGLDWIMKSQKPNGQISGNMYEQALCTIALCEAFGRAPDERVGIAARKAADFCVQAVGLDQGWRYTPNVEKSDMSVTAWVIQALKAAKLARIKFDDRTFQRALTFVDRLTDQGGTADSNGTVAYFYDENPGGRPSMTAAGMVIRQFTGMGAKAPLLVKGAEFLKKSEPVWDRNKDFYLWYYATYAMHNMGGEYRIWWNTRMRDMLLEKQVRVGHQTGSWSPDKDQWATRDNAGRVYVTALGALCLEVYYRYGEALQTFGTAPDFDDLFFQ